MSNSFYIKLTFSKIDILRGVLYEYYNTHSYYNSEEEAIHAQLEQILADAENEIRFT
jgi:hypothetical protein